MIVTVPQGGLSAKYLSTFSLNDEEVLKLELVDLSSYSLFF